MIDPDTLPDFADIASLIRQHAQASPSEIALIEGDSSLNYAQLDALMDRVALSLQRDDLQPTDSIALCAASTLTYAVVFLGALRAGLAVAPLPPGATADSLQRMIRNSDAKRVFVAPGIDLGEPPADGGPLRVIIDGPDAQARPDADHAATPASIAFEAWLLPPASADAASFPTIQPSWPFNIIYSSGTTGEPKGIIQSQAMRWAYARRASRYGYGPQAVALLSTPLYSNTTLVVFFPVLSFGGTVVLMPKFDAARWLALSEQHRVTHTMLVPVQYQRLLDHPDFDRYDQSAMQWKFATSAPFNPALKADALRRWPGALVEFYGMTEGGGSCVLEASAHPDKLHTVGKPAPGHEIRLIDADGHELPHTLDAQGGRHYGDQVGELVGRSPGMMDGYHKRPDATRDAEWFDADGRRYIRTGDVGKFDADGFLILMDRRKDMIISGGFNVYPSDLEAVIRDDEAVADVAVVGIASRQWGETPVAYVVRRPGTQAIDEAALLARINARLGKLQRLHGLRFIDELPRSAIGKVLKRELRDAWGV